MSGSGRRAPAALLATLTVAGIAAATLIGADDEDGGASVDRSGRAVAVTRRTLVQREIVEGTLGYAGSRTVLNRLGGSAAGGGTAPTTSAASATAVPTIPAVALGAAVSATPAVARTAGSPSGDDRSGDAPSGDDPSADDPSGDDPSGDPPSDDGPSGDPPSGDAPSGDKRSGDAPSGDPPSGDAPSGDKRYGNDRSGDSPSVGPRGGQAPRGGSPSGGTPARDGGSGPSSAGGDGDSTGSGSGTVTALPRPGSVVRRGGVLYRLDGEPVLLMYGRTPAYRELSEGVSDGPDVRQLERNLSALGFDPGAVDETFTSATAAAVADWQEAVGLPETGAVEVGRVVFLPGPRRIGELKTAVGDVLGAGSEVLETSSTKRVVTIELDAGLQSLARRGDGVEVTLPDQSIVRGRITQVGRVAREKESSGSDADPNAAAGAEQELVIDVTVRLRSARDLGRLDEAPVSVALARESRRNVLAVPVDALVARRGGGYGVELAAGRRIVPVRTGLFAGGYVEVSGRGIRPGTRVVVPDA